MKKVVLITGASSGMGKVTAEDLIKEGHVVYCAARKTESMRDLESLGGHLLKLDIAKEAEIKPVVEKVIKEQGKIDVLWNNAGFGLYGSVEETTIDEARYQFEVNLFGLARLTQLVVPHMRERKSGLIINTSSVGGKIYSPLGAWYHATKHAVEGWSDCLRLELKQFGINVTIVEPGLIKTNFGPVMTEPMMERSGYGPYRKLAEGVDKLMATSYENAPDAASPKVISKTVSRIIQSKNPKTRYAAGHNAKITLVLRKWLSDKAFDNINMRLVK